MATKSELLAFGQAQVDSRVVRAPVADMVRLHVDCCLHVPDWGPWKTSGHRNGVAADLVCYGRHSNGGKDHQRSVPEEEVTGTFRLVRALLYHGLSLGVRQGR